MKKKSKNVSSPAKPKAEKPMAAFVLSLIAGILIVVSGVVLVMVSKLLSDRIGQIMIGASSYITLAGIAYPIAGLKLLLGFIVMIGAIILFVSAGQRMAWSVIILVISIIALILSIFPPEPIGLVGSILGILGGALALSWRKA